MTDDFVNIDASISGLTTSLLRRAGQQQEGAWQRVMKIYAPLVYFWCRRKGLQQADAADVGQEVFVSVVRKLPDFQKREATAKDAFRAWLKTITHHKIIDHIRAKAGRAIADGGTDANQLMKEMSLDFGQTATNEMNQERAILLSRIVETIHGEFSEQDWQAFYRTTAEQQSPADVAEDLGITRNQVYLAKSRILRRLRTEFVNDEE